MVFLVLVVFESSRSVDNRGNTWWVNWIMWPFVWKCFSLWEESNTLLISFQWILDSTYYSTTLFSSSHRFDVASQCGIAHRSPPSPSVPPSPPRILHLGNSALAYWRPLMCLYPLWHQVSSSHPTTIHGRRTLMSYLSIILWTISVQTQQDLSK